MWKDTALVLTTDHGFLLSEHDWWGKCRMPYYEEISHIPLIIHDPRFPEAAGKRTNALTQTADLMPTMLGFHNAKEPIEIRSRDLAHVLRNPDEDGRSIAVFGVFGGPIGITDGEYALYYYPPDVTREGLREYTLMPTHMTSYFTSAELKTSQLSPGFDFTKGIPVLSIAALKEAKRVPMNDGLGFEDIGTSLYDLRNDPTQKQRIKNTEIEMHLIAEMLTVLVQHDTPPEVYQWYGLNKPKSN